MTGTLGTCKFNGGRANAKIKAEKPFHLDRIEKRFDHVTKYIISFRKMHKDEI